MSKEPSVLEIDPEEEFDGLKRKDYSGDFRYWKNRKTVEEIATRFFGGSQLHSFDPNWRFVYPPYIHKGDTFGVSDFAMGFIAESLGLKWYWGMYGGEIEHPMVMMRKVIRHLEEDVENTRNMFHEWLKWAEREKLEGIDRPHYHKDEKPITVFRAGKGKVHLFNDCVGLKRAGGSVRSESVFEIFVDDVCANCIKRKEKD